MCQCVEGKTFSTALSSQAGEGAAEEGCGADEA